MRIRIFGEVDPIEDEYYVTDFHLTEFLDVNLVLEFENIPFANTWIIEYDSYIGNILNIYNNIESELKNYLKKQTEKKLENVKKENMSLTHITILPEMEDYAVWHYKGYIDPANGDKDIKNIFAIEIVTDNKGKIMEFILY